MKRKPIMFSLMLVFLLLVSSTAFAQDFSDFCGDLAEADCALLEDAQTAAMGLHSGSTQFELTLSLSNIPDAPFESLNFGLNGSGSYAVDPALMEMMHSMQDNPTAMFSTPEAMTEWLISFLNGVSGDMNITLSIPAELTGMMSSEEMTVPETLSIGLRIVDGVGYANLEEIAAIMPDAGVPAGWVGVDLVEFMELAMAQSGFGEMSEINPEFFQSYMGGWQDPEFLAEFMSVERLEDTSVAGQPAAVFRYVFDYGALFQSDVFRQMMQAQMAAVSEMTGEEIDEAAQAEIDEAMSMMGPMFEGINLELRQVIGLDDKYIHVTEVHMDWDMSDFMAMVEPDSDMAAPVVVFDMTVTSSDFNVTPDISAPEDAMIIPLDAMMPSEAESASS